MAGNRMDVRNAVKHRENYDSIVTYFKTLKTPGMDQMVLLAKNGFVDPETTSFGNNMSGGADNSVRNYPTLRYFGITPEPGMNLVGRVTDGTGPIEGVVVSDGDGTHKGYAGG